MTHYLFENLLNPNFLTLLNYAMYNHTGLLVLERVPGTMNHLYSFIDMPLYRNLIRRYNLPFDTLILSMLLQCFLSLAQLQDMCHFLHADLKIDNIFLRFTDTLQVVRRHESQSNGHQSASCLQLQQIDGENNVLNFLLPMSDYSRYWPTLAWPHSKLVTLRFDGQCAEIWPRGKTARHG